MHLFGLRISLCVVAALCLSAVSSFASTDSITHTLEFSAEDLTIQEADGYERVGFADALTTLEEGHPELPLKLVRFAVPEGSTAVGARAFVHARRDLDGVFAVRPRQPEVPLSRPEMASWVDPNPNVYASLTPYPENVCRLIDVGNMAGRTIATVAVHPVQYVPAEGRLILNSEIEIVLSLAPAARTGRQPLRSAEAEAFRSERVRALVVNPRDVETVWTPRAARSDDVEYLIVTSSTYVSQFQPLADWKTQKGVRAEIVTTSWIYENYDGVDNQDKIRNCIIDYYETQGTMWVLLGGDTSVVPARIVFAMNSGAGDDHIRCDLYYGDLDGTWNADGDGKWGEISQDDIDMYADVFVGRAPVDSSTEAARFVQKILTYEGAPAGDSLPADYQRNMLFMAEVLWTEPWTDGGVCKDMIDDDSVPPAFDPITKLYQTNGLLSKSRVVGELNNGHNIINHNGHAYYNVMSIGSGGGLYRSDFDGLTNAPRYGIMYSIGCWPAAIDYNCIAEHWVNAPNGGGVAFVGNSRFGWGSPGNPGSGTSDLFDREFFHQIYNEGLDRIGVATAAHKDAFVSVARSGSYFRYCLYELNLLGDPEMRIWTEEPTTAVVSHPSGAPLGEHPFVVVVSRYGDPVANASVFLAGGGVSDVAVTGPDGVATLHPAPEAEGTITITVTGQGILPYTAAVPVVDQPADTDAPAAVEDLALADPFDLGGVITLDWSSYVAPSDFAQYRIYREDGPFADVSALTPIEGGIIDSGDTQWVDTTVENTVSYYYAVTAVDLNANELMAVESNGPIAATVNSRILVWDADDNDLPFDGVGDDFTESDGAEAPWVDALDEIGELYTNSRTLPADLSPFDLIVYLGGVVNFGDPLANAAMTDDEASALTAFIDAGGSVYVEEPNFGSAYLVNGTPITIELWNRFHATYTMGSSRGGGNVETLDGVAGTVAEGLAYSYDFHGWPDQFVAVVGPDGAEGASSLWTDEEAETRGSLYVDSGTGAHLYMVPVLLGGLEDGPEPSTRLEYVTRILEDLGLTGTTGIDGQIAGRSNWLAQNAPNPFNPATTIRFSVAHEGAHVSLRVYDVAGKLVRELVNGTTPAGEHEARWDGRNASGVPVASGVYFSRMEADGWAASRKMVLLK